MSGPVEAAREAWGADAPDWVLCLAEACAASSQAQVAAKLGRSPALVSTVLRARYAGNMAAVEELVRGVFMAATLDCPALGTIPTHDCVKWRRRAKDFAGHNALAVQMYRACHRCPRFLKPQEAADA